MRRTCCSILFVLTASAGASLADQIVVFDDGRTLEVAGIAREDGLAQIELAGGGSFAVPAERVTNWDDLARRAAQKPVRAVRTAANVPAGDGGGAYHGVRNVETSLWRRAAGQWADLLSEAASRHEVDPALLTALAHVESRFDPTAISPKGAQGMLQLMPATAQRFGVQDSFDVSQNVEGGARYLRWLLDRFDGNAELALAGYNAGENAVERYQGVPPFAETRTYVARVMNQFNRFNQGTTAR